MSYSERAKQILEALLDETLTPAEVASHAGRATGANGAPEDVNELFITVLARQLRANTRNVAEEAKRREIRDQIRAAGDAAEDHLPTNLPGRRGRQ